MKRRQLLRRWYAVFWLITLPMGAVLSYASAEDVSGDRSRVTPKESAAGLHRPTLAKDFKPGKSLSRAEYRRIGNKIYDMRLQMAAQVEPAAGTNSVPAPVADESGEAARTRFHGTPSSFLIDRNNANTVANTNTCGTGSTLAEPAAANEGRQVFYTGNLRHQEYSKNSGSTWICATAYPAGPAEAPTAFGDTDVIYDHSRGVTFHSVLYVNSGVTNGIIRIFVRQKITGADNCFYDIDPDPAATNVVADYPHLGLSNNFLYLNANRVQFPAKTWLGAYMERDNLDQLADCGSVDFNFITFTNAGGQRILVPGQGARDVMYFAWVDSTTSWRIFSWADNSGSIQSSFPSVGAMTFGDPDCRGGNNNTDWADGLEASITGFNVRTTVGNDFVTVWAATAADASHTQAHIHGAVFRIGTDQNSLTLVQQPVIFINTSCVGIPSPTVNDRGDIGMALAVGSQAGGGGSAVHPDVLMKDEFNPGPGGFTLFPIASGDNNPANLRYGDYFTVRRNAPCGEWFDATGYALSGGTALANVNARYVEFGRGRDEQCYLAWRNKAPST